MAHRIRRNPAALGVTALAILFVSLGVSFSHAQAPAKAPDADKILERYVAATGGRAAYDKLQNSVSKATLDIPSVGITIDLMVYSARPNKFRSIAQSPAIGSIERGTDGKIFWEKSIMQGARILEGEELADALREAAFEGLAYWRTIYDSVAVAGVDTVAGSLCDKVVMKAKGGKPRTLFFDQKSGLITKTQSIASTQMGDIPIDAFVSDYRKVGGVLQAYKTVMSIMGQERVITAASIEYNASIPDSIFTIPAEVQALLKK
jgi:hypothetical protein